MKKALVQPDGRVAQVEPVNQAPASGGIPFPVAAPLAWLDCPDDVVAGYRWNGSTFNAPPAPSAPDAQTANALQSAQRTRAQQLEDLERRMSLGAPQGEINAAILNLLKGQ